jgi:hypothetical protein
MGVSSSIFVTFFNPGCSACWWVLKWGRAGWKSVHIRPSSTPRSVPCCPGPRWRRVHRRFAGGQSRLAWRRLRPARAGPIRQPRPRQCHRFMQFLLRQLPGRQAGQVLGDVNATLLKFQQFYLFTLLAGAKNNPQWRRFARLLFTFGQAVEHLGGGFGSAQRL